MIIWIMGLSGSGKSTLAREIIKHVKKKHSNTLLIDGDEFREIFNNDLGYTIEDRKKNALRISRFCKFCERQNVNVVCAILSIFPEIRTWNKKNLSNYYEVFIDTPLTELKKRDGKRLYEKFRKKEIKNVVGLDIKFQKPKSANLTIINNKKLDDLLKFAKNISTKISR